MAKVQEELSNYATNDLTNYFFWYHNTGRLGNLEKMSKNKKLWEFRDINRDRPINRALKIFFCSSLDEARTKLADDFAEYALYIADLRDLSYFRRAVARREYSADIDYNRQRDHAAHTLNNYILGWYFFEKSPILKKAFKIYFNRLGNNYNELTYDENRFYEINNMRNDASSLINNFGDVWPIVSLLHDIGYILEGSLSAVSSDVENERVTNGAKVIHDFFSHWFWKDMDIDSKTAKSVVATMGIMLPDFSRTRSLSALGDYLCDVGSCENIREDMRKNNKYITIPKDPYAFNVDAFALWEQRYNKKHGINNKMSEIMKIVSKEFKRNMWIGSEFGIRNLNHGVCSGLISLMALTFSHEIYCGFKDNFNYYFNFCYQQMKKVREEYWRISFEQYEKIRNSILEDFVSPAVFIRNAYQSNFWFEKVLWATSAAAIHDIVQKKHWDKVCKQHSESSPELTLDYNQDPLAYLGVLVDILQEWDRYTVSGEEAFVGQEPLQGCEVELSTTIDGKVMIKFPKTKYKDYKKDVEETLKRCLDKWDDIVEIQT